MREIEWNDGWRWKPNPLVRWLLDNGGIDLTRLAIEAHEQGWSNKDQAEFAALIGYSIDGWAELDYVNEYLHEEGSMKY